MTALARDKRRKARTTRSKPRSVRSEASADDPFPLTKPQIRELQRRLRDADDRTRYLLVSSLAPGCTLYYDVTSDNYVMNEPARATLFKRRPGAVAIQSTLGAGVTIVRCRVDASDALVPSSLPARCARRPRRGKPRAD
jgi:hypothetical protein